jgi:hypothetical protein
MWHGGQLIVSSLLSFGKAYRITRLTALTTLVRLLHDTSQTRSVRIIFSSRFTHDEASECVGVGVQDDNSDGGNEDVDS